MCVVRSLLDELLSAHYLVEAVEQVAETGPLQCRGWVEGVEACSEGVVALLQHGFQQGKRLRQVALGVIVQFGQAVVHAF